MDERKGPRATSSQQRLSVAIVLAQVGPDTHIKICTGDDLTQDLRLGLLAEGFPEDRLHIEAFALALSVEDLGITISLGAHSFRPARSVRCWKRWSRARLHPTANGAPAIVLYVQSK